MTMPRRPAARSLRVTVLLLLFCQSWGLPPLGGGWSWRPLPLLPQKSTTTKVDNTSSFSKSASKKKSTPRTWAHRMFDNIASGTVAVGPRVLHHAIYWFTAADAVQSILHNEYRDIIGMVVATRSGSGSNNMMVPSVYSKLFFFARLRPRLLYAVGALLRALQLCTPLGRIIDPTIGVGAGINLCAILASSRWVKPLILGWTTTKYAWTWFGANRVQFAFLPITLSIREWEEQKKKKTSGKDLDD